MWGVYMKNNLKNSYLLIYQKKDIYYNRIMDCRITFADAASAAAFIEQIKKDRNVLNYTIVSKECFRRNEEREWISVDGV